MQRPDPPSPGPLAASGALFASENGLQGGSGGADAGQQQQAGGGGSGGSGGSPSLEAIAGATVGFVAAGVLAAFGELEPAQPQQQQPPAVREGGGRAKRQRTQVDYAAMAAVVPAPRSPGPSTSPEVDIGQAAGPSSSRPAKAKATAQRAAACHGRGRPKPKGAVPGAAKRTMEVALEAKKGTLKKHSQYVYDQKSKLIHFYLNYLADYDTEHIYFDPAKGTDLADEENGPLVATNLARWAGDNCPHFWEHAPRLYNRRKPPMAAMNWDYFMTVHSALQQTFNFERAKAAQGRAVEQKQLTDYVCYKMQFEAIRQAFHVKGVINPLGPDPQAGTAADTYSFEQYRQVMLKLMLDPSFTAAREASAFTFLHNSVGRGDDIRLLMVAHLLRPIRLMCIGPVPFMVLAGVLRGAKTQQAGARGYKGVPRNLDPVVCPQRALAAWFFARWVQNGSPFPDPRDAISKDDNRRMLWLGVALWCKSTNPMQSVEYKEQNSAVHKLFDWLTKMRSVVHAFRKGGVALLDQCGISMDEIARLGMWLVNAMTKSYLTFFPPAAMLALAGMAQAAVQKDFEVYWHERMTLMVPEELKRHLFPFIEEFEARVEEMPAAERREAVSVESMRYVLQHLAIVGVQDSLWLAADDAHPEYQKVPMVRHMMRHPAFLDRVDVIKRAKLIHWWHAEKPRTIRELLIDMASLHTAPQPVAEFLAGQTLTQQLLQQAGQRLPVDLGSLEQEQQQELCAMMEEPQPAGCDLAEQGPYTLDDATSGLDVLTQLSPSPSRQHRQQQQQQRRQLQCGADDDLPPRRLALEVACQQQAAQSAAGPQPQQAQQQQQQAAAMPALVVQQQAAEAAAGQAGAVHQLVGMMVQPAVPMDQRFLPCVGNTQLPTQFMVEQNLSYAAPYASTNPQLVAHGPAQQYAPHLAHIIGGAAAGQAARLRQQAVQQHAMGHVFMSPEQLSLLSSLTYNTQAGGSGGYAMVPVLPAAAAVAAGSSAPPAGNDKKRKGSKRDTTCNPRPMPQLSDFSAMGGLAAIYDWFTKKDAHGISIQMLEEGDQGVAGREWRKDLPRQRWSDVKLLLDHIEETAKQRQAATKRTASRKLVAQGLEAERVEANKGKAGGLTTYMMNLRKKAKNT